MMLHKDLEVKEGLWIEEQWIRDAGLGRRLRVTVKTGEIRINPGACRNFSQPIAAELVPVV